MKILNKVALVTGGAEGIGKALCQRLLEHGAKLVAILDINADLGQQTATEFSEKFGSDKVRFIHCDVSKEAKLHDNTLIFSLAVINGCLIAEELMTKEPRPEKGIIVNTSSISGMVVQDTNILNSSYFAAKHGVVAFTKSLPASADNFSKDLRVVAICPGIVLTNIFKKQDVVDDNVMTKELDNNKDYVTNVSVVVDAFILAIEDESLHGDIITAVGSEGIKVVT
ncbi:putative 15-hydroxyprostaglandin dehydrogenase [Apostichopus japonicus]|uniref:15-hydroxyprostaglandin dehydrogenase [NAD(+)] n=1 Tax=Stichopus japonicus TaxID=307972 RepID=A0A2G8KHC5_STIJA|nr:putative 15-hydroxyprostaglandin dehydrogenase [Apostichopus japonicus]